MKGRTKTLALAGCLALAAPAVVLARGGGTAEVENFGSSGQQTVWATSAAASTNSRQYQPVANLAQGADVPVDMSSPSPLQVSVDLRSGKGIKLRVIDDSPGSAPPSPRSVLVQGKGVSTATFYMPSPSELERPTLEWKKVGRNRARAASVVAHLIGVPD